MGLGNPLKNNFLFDLVEKSGCDISFVQETLISLNTTFKALSRRLAWPQFLVTSYR